MAETSREAISYISDQVRPWVDLVDRLRAVGIEKDLAIPQIAVMGDQSSGKSSLLEAISGVQFPRGAGLVTKCATELRMKNKRGAPWTANICLTWNAPQPSDAGVVETPEQLGAKITKLTEVLLLARGKNATFEPEHSILIELTSADVPDLTIIDLPGIVRTTLEGQSKSVVEEVDSLLQRYLTQERTVILAVIPSNVDLATVDIIERASKADPQGNRTVGVLTKPDMIPEGCEEEKVNTLMNLTKPLKLGYIMVKNRSQKQIDEGMSLEDAKISEATWFRSHLTFGKMEPSYFGVEHLAKKLTEILVDRIKESIPQLYTEVSALLEKTKMDLEAFGAKPPETPEQMRSALMDISQTIAGEIKSAVGGAYDTSLLSKNQNLRIFARFRKSCASFSQQALQQKPEWTVKQLKDIIADMQGRELPGFPKPAVLEFLVRDFVEKWQVLSMELLQKAKDMAIETCVKIIEFHIPTYRRLASAMKTTIQKLLTCRSDAARANIVSDLVKNELSPMTMNHYFLDTYNKIRLESFERVLTQCFQQSTNMNTGLEGFRAHVLKKYQEIHSIGAQSNEDYEAENLQSMLDAYWKTSSKRFIDNVVQNIDRILLQDLDAQTTKSFLLFSENAEKMTEFFAEDHNLKEIRIRLESKYQRLQNAQKLLAEK